MIALHGIQDSGVKSFQHETHRLVPPTETLERLSPLLPKLGITRVANITGLDTINIPTIVVCRPNSRSLAVSQGKGLTLAAAKVSALMESLEAHHAETASVPLRLGTATEVGKRVRICNIHDLSRTSLRPVDVTTPFLWVEGTDLLQKSPAWIPYETVHINSTFTGRINPGIFCCSTNGLASGNHILEAISHAICEIVERDSTTLWSLKGDTARDTTRVDLDSVDDPLCRQALDKFAACEGGRWHLGYHERRWHPVTSCLLSPTATLIHGARSIPRPGRDAILQKAHIALLRALTSKQHNPASPSLAVLETTCCAQNTIVIAIRINFGSRTNCWHTRALSNHSLQVPTFAASTFHEDVTWELLRLHSVGIHECVVVDLTQSEFDVPVVKVNIPGLEGNHAFPRYHPGRRARRAMENSL